MPLPLPPLGAVVTLKSEEASAVRRKTQLPAQQRKTRTADDGRPGTYFSPNRQSTVSGDSERAIRHAFCLAAARENEQLAPANVLSKYMLFLRRPTSVHRSVAFGTAAFLPYSIARLYLVADTLSLPKSVWFCYIVQYDTPPKSGWSQTETLSGVRAGAKAEHTY